MLKQPFRILFYLWDKVFYKHVVLFFAKTWFILLCNCTCKQ